MALIKCPKCSKEISDKAEKCIHCGCPLSNTLNNNDQFVPPPIPISEEKKQLNDLHAMVNHIELTCPNCGVQFKPGSKFCGKCGTPKYLNDSQYQNYNTTPYTYQNSVATSSYMQSTYASNGNIPKPRFMALGIIGLVFGIIGFLILPIVFNVIGLIFGIITFASNPKEEREATKAIWQYKNKARGVGMSALLINIIGIILMIFNMMRFSGMF